MGFWDFLTGDEAAQVERHARRLVNIDAQVEDREFSAHWLAENGSERAILGLLGRFGMTLEHHMKDSKEKELVYELLLSLGERVVEPTKKWVATAQNFVQPLRLVGHFEGPEAVVALLVAMLDREHDPFRPEKKRQILIKLAEHRDPRICAATAPCLQDFDEGIRYAAAEAVLAQDDPEAREPLARALANPEEESNRLRVRIAGAFHQRGWDLGEHSDAVAKRCPAGWRVHGGRLAPA